MLLYILLLILGGLIVGALGRLALPGPNPMSIGMTIAIGVGGSLIAGLLGRVLIGRPFGLIVSVLAAALLVWLYERSRGGAGARP
jgi:uncharacterized membrane protein YeaQ/YmgE (transglycosylase-associated protein family)